LCIAPIALRSDVNGWWNARIANFNLVIADPE